MTSQPAPALALPATQPAGGAPVDALVLYGKARDAFARGERYQAISLLDKAAALDPNSFQLQYDLGTTYAAGNENDDRAIEAFSKAAAIQPDHLDLQTQLGRQYLVRGELTRAIAHLRLAQQTSNYDFDDAGAAVADFFLARALKQAGYDRAALQQYDHLIRRLGNPSLEIRQNVELAYLINHPELLYVDLGELYEKNGNTSEALKAYSAASDREPDNQDLESHVARLLASQGQKDLALSKAADVVVKSRANADSLALLNDVCRRLHLKGGAVTALSRLHSDHPDDRAVLFALTDALLSAKRPAEAETLIASQWNKSPADIPLTHRFVDLCEARGDTTQAARVLVIALAHAPDALRNFSPMWTRLLRPTRVDRLRLNTLQRMQVAPADEAARQFWISRVADLYHRDALTRSSLAASAKATPPFAPAYRELLELAWEDEALSDDQKIAAGAKLIEQARSAGDTVLATELDGLSLLKQKQNAAAAAKMAEAMRAGGRSPTLLLDYALATRNAGRDAQFETLMWKLISDHPLFGDSYAILFRYYADIDGGQSDAIRVLSSWLAADPTSEAARVLNADVQLQVGQRADAEASLDALFEEDPDNTEVLQALQDMYARANQMPTFVSKLELHLASHPQDVDVAGRLANVYVSQKRVGEAIRLVDATRAAVSKDADLLYAVAQLYTLLNQKQSAEDTLAAVIRLDPENAGANNDLGYSWADDGKHLGRAEQLIRTAVSVEPDNQSFLDSLGWVLYKRGKFDQAKVALEQAIGPAAFPDPVVLDHLGDVLYRLHDGEAATRQWQRSLKDLGETNADRDDLRQLRLQLLQKLKATETHQPADVAPIAQADM